MGLLLWKQYANKNNIVDEEQEFNFDEITFEKVFQPFIFGQTQIEKKVIEAPTNLKPV